MIARKCRTIKKQIPFFPSKYTSSKNNYEILGSSTKETLSGNILDSPKGIPNPKYILIPPLTLKIQTTQKSMKLIWTP